MTCSERDRGKFDEALEQAQLTSNQMGLMNIFDGSGSLLVGFFATGFIYDRVVPLAPETQLLQLTIVVIALSLPLLSAIGWALRSELAYAAWRDNEDWCLLLMQFAQVLRTTCFFLCTHFVYGLVVGSLVASRCSLLECFALIPVLVVAFHFFVRVLRPLEH